MHKFPLWLAATLLAWAAGARADEVAFGQRDRLAGTILGMDGGRLRFGSNVIGELNVPWNQVGDLRSDGNLAVYAEGGKVLVGVLAGMEGVMLRVQTAAGLQSVDRATVQRISTDIPRGENPAPLVTWKGNLQFGLGYATGNTERQEFSLGASLQRKGARSELKWKGNAERGETKNVKDLARVSSQLGYSRDQQGRAFFSLDASHDHDDVKQLELRGNYSLSLGYRLIDTSPNRWQLLFGGNYTDEHYKTQRTDEVTMRLESQLDWVVFGQSRLGFSVVAYPSVKETNHLRTSADLSLAVPITRTVDLTVSATDEFDNKPPTEVGKNDFRVRTSLGYNF